MDNEAGLGADSPCNGTGRQIAEGFQLGTQHWIAVLNSCSGLVW